MIAELRSLRLCASPAAACMSIASGTVTQRYSGPCSSSGTAVHDSGAWQQLCWQIVLGALVSVPIAMPQARSCP